MKATKIIYKKLFNLGNYQHEEVGIELEVEQGENAYEVLENAKKFVNGLNPNNAAKKEYENALYLLKDKESYNYKRVIEAQEIVYKYEANQNGGDNLPF